MRILPGLILAFLTVACDKASSPAAPTPVPTSITVSLSSTVWIGESKQAAAAAAMNNGTTQAVTTGWRSENSAVASVTDSGMVTGVSYGSATISVSLGGQQGQQTIRVLPDYEGAWSGTYRVTTCTPYPSDFYSYFCDGLTPGSVGNVAFTMTQSGEMVSGQFTAGGRQFATFVTAMNGDGGIVVSGTNISSPYFFEAHWLMKSLARGQITGTTHWVRSGSAGLVGGAVVEGVIVSLSK
jgi:hypothetical protein